MLSKPSLLQTMSCYSELPQDVLRLIMDKRLGTKSYWKKKMDVCVKDLWRETVPGIKVLPVYRLRYRQLAAIGYEDYRCIQWAHFCRRMSRLKPKSFVALLKYANEVENMKENRQSLEVLRKRNMDKLYRISEFKGDSNCKHYPRL